jgi:RHS repeat-associated protein
VGSPVSRRRFQLDNHLGTVAVETDDAGAVISYEEYHPYGTSAYRAHKSTVEVSAKRYRYIGCEDDEETRLYLMGARYYAAWLCRWTAADPAGTVDGTNLYAYVRGSPVSFRDPNGTDRWYEDPQFHAAEERELKKAIAQSKLKGNLGKIGKGASAKGYAGQGRRQFKEKVAILPFLVPVPSQFLVREQQLPDDAPVGLKESRQVTSGGQAAVANFSRDVAPGTSIANLTLQFSVGLASFGSAVLAAAQLAQATKLKTPIVPTPKTPHAGETPPPGGGAPPAGGSPPKGGSPPSGPSPIGEGGPVEGAGGTYLNQLPERLAEETAEMARVGAAPIQAGTPEFEAAVNQGTIKWVVTESGELLITPAFVGDVEISHAALAGGKPVLAAGQADIAAGGGQYVGIGITEHSGHYKPPPESLEIGKQAFARWGITFGD